jgi:hypothetical protein
LTSETKRLAREYIEEGANEDLAFAYYIYTLVNPTSGFMYDASDQDEVQLRKHHALEDLMVHDPLSVFVYREKCLQAFRWIGLDIRGGFANIDRLIRYSKTGFGTASILVTDAERARKYANIGVHVDAMSLMHEYPKTFEEAVKNYALLLELTKENFRTPRKIDQEIEDLLPFVCTERDEIVWGLRREKFVLKVRDQYREVVAEMAMEEKVRSVSFPLSWLTP